METQRHALAALAAGLGLTLAGPALGSVPAFRGAEGFGAETPGGRGGRVVEVTTLANSGPGSLRAAVTSAEPRIVVFRVSGEIVVDSPIIVTQPFLTVAGQTAPGDGITIRNGAPNDWAAFAVQTHDVVLRHLRLRPGRTGPHQNNNDALQISHGAYNVVVDHCSMSWTSDEVLDLAGPIHDVTIQWSILSEGLTSESSDWDSKGVLAAEPECERVSFHHNLLAHNWDRNPKFSSEGLVDLVNNLVYDPGRSNADLWDLQTRPILANFVGNVVRKGPSTHPWLASELILYQDGDDGPRYQVYLRDNLGPRRPTGLEPETAILSCFTVYGQPPHPPCDPLPYVVAARHDVPPVTTYPASELLTRLLPDVGATRPVRDSVDTCIVDGVANLGGRIVREPAEGCGPWPVLAPGDPPPDTDHDGMPDAWETEYGFNPVDPADGPIDTDGDGWTNVEEFLDQLHPGDRDNDGQADADDCAPGDPQGGVPPEAIGLRFAAGSSTEITWAAAPFADEYEVTAGRPGGFPAGDYGSCRDALDPDLTDTRFVASEAPAAGDSLGYLVRGRNLACPAAGSLGTTSAGVARVNGSPDACP